MSFDPKRQLHQFPLPKTTTITTPQNCSKKEWKQSARQGIKSKTQRLKWLTEYGEVLFMRLGAHPATQILISKKKAYKGL
jgi:hypothetical protein